MKESLHIVLVQQAGILSALATLASEDDDACRRICELELMNTLRTFDDAGCIASGCVLLNTVANKSNEDVLIKLG